VLIVEFDPRVGIWLSVVVIVLHAGLAWWLGNSTWITAGGAFVIVLGVVTIARSFLREGEQKIRLSGRTVLRKVRTNEAGELVSAEPEKDRERHADASAELRIGPILVVIGTLINGYGGLIGDWALK